MDLKQQRISKVINIGGFSGIRSVNIGGNFPIAIQTMWKDRLSITDIEASAKRIVDLKALGCDILRFSVPDLQTAEALGNLAQAVSMPFVADIHFDHKIALRCLDFPIAKIRINPGNIGERVKVQAVLEKAASGNIPIRIGVNAGSLPRDIRQMVKEGMSTAQALALAAEKEIAFFKEFGFDNYLVSMKASGIADTIEANRILGSVTDAPLHVGVTEAGPLIAGITANTAALLTLLTEGIGDTLRVSLSDTMENEIIAGKEIIRAAQELMAMKSTVENRRLKPAGVKIVSCPRCGRHGFDTHDFTARWMQKLYAMETSITVAIMGCEVNGPEEAKHADIGITGAGDRVLIFKHGKVIRTLTPAEADTVFLQELENL